MDDAEISADRAYEQLGKEIREEHEVLTPSEAQWSDRQPFLQENGYMLRPRYRPGWIPSWVKDPSLDFMACEDFHFLPQGPSLIDATRISDGRLVYIKRVASDSEELKIALKLGSDSQPQDKRNHCVPILDHFPESDGAFTYMVMPFLRSVDDPPFETVENVVEFIDQILQGLVFMHEQGVAHRDCSVPNILMNADPLFPKGFHPVAQDEQPNGIDSAPVLSRANRTLQFHYVDFGISVQIAPDSPERLVVGPHGRDRDVPELSATVPYDPFKVDIFIIGNLLHNEFEVKFSNLEFLQTLAGSMTEVDPADRPSAVDALKKWQNIRKGLLSVHRAWRLRPKEEHWKKALPQEIFALGYLPPYFAHRILFKAQSMAAGLSCVSKQ